MSGQIGWIDLTIPDAPALRDFYQGVAGLSHFANPYFSGYPRVSRNVRVQRVLVKK